MTFVCFIASQHTLNQLRLQQYTTHCWSLSVVTSFHVVAVDLFLSMVPKPHTTVSLLSGIPGVDDGCVFVKALAVSCADCGVGCRGSARRVHLCPAFACWNRQTGIAYNKGVELLSYFPMDAVDRLASYYEHGLHTTKEVAPWHTFALDEHEVNGRMPATPSKSLPVALTSLYPFTTCLGY